MQWGWTLAALSVKGICVLTGVCLALQAVYESTYRGNASEQNIKGKLKKGRLDLKGNLALQR